MLVRKLFFGLSALPASLGSTGSLFSPIMSTLCHKCAIRTISSFARSSSKFLLGENSSEKLKQIMANLGVKLNIMSVLLTQQCNRVASLRLRRAYQILLLYQRIYGEQQLMQKISMNMRSKSRPLLALLSATLFQWDNERVTDEELQKCTEEIEEVHKLVEFNHQTKQERGVEACSHDLIDWEQIVDRDDFKIWRRFIPDSNLYQYRVFGHFTDIPPRAFYNTQVDLGYWKDWDKNTMETHVVDKDSKTDSEVVHWIYKFPYPMYPRDYVYVRRCKVDSTSNTMVITARATVHPSCPESDSYVRVATYCSQMVIKPHTTFDENGFDYVMTYCDDPKTNFPPMCYNWLASTGVHEFLERVHKASQRKHERSNESPATRIDNTSGNLYSKMVHH